MLVAVTTTENYVCIYQSSKLWTVLAVPVGSTVSIDDSMSYIEHDTAADITSWMTANSVTTKDSMALHAIEDQNSDERENLRVAIDMPSLDDDIEVIESEMVDGEQ